MVSRLPPNRVVVRRRTLLDWKVWVIAIMTLALFTFCMSGWLIEGPRRLAVWLIAGPRRLLSRILPRRSLGTKAGLTLAAVFTGQEPFNHIQTLANKFQNVAGWNGRILPRRPLVTKVVLTLAAVFTGVMLAIIVALPARAADEDPAFRIINIKAEYGHVIFEVEHLNPDGTRDYMENYTYRGEEWFKKPRVMNTAGQILLDNGAVAPYMTVGDRTFQYLPPGEQWRRDVDPFVDIHGILDAAILTREKRIETGWEKGDLRLVTSPLNYTRYNGDGLDDYAPSDEDGALSLVGYFTPFLGMAYSIVDGKAVPYYGDLDPADMTVGTEMGTVEIFYSANNDGGGSIGFTVGRNCGVESYSTCRNSAGNAVGYYWADAYNRGTQRAWDDDKWALFERWASTFDTSSLPDGAVITDTVWSSVGTYTDDDFTDTIDVVDGTFASYQYAAASDYGLIGTTIYAEEAIAGLSTDSSSYNDFTFNATGRAAINKTGVSYINTRVGIDTDNVDPGGWVGGAQNGSDYRFASEEETLAGDKRPKLTVTYAVPTAAVTGTIGDGSSEQEVRDGGGTVILTLTDATWVADDGTFAGIRQDIIDGLDSAQSEAYGWNAEVRDKMAVGSVVRTSATIVTVTVAAGDVGDYRITSEETITATVPASSNSVAAALTATPTFAISTISETAATTGTLSDDGTTAEVIAGGETVIITLTNTKWVADDGTFAGVRQDIIDGMVSGSSDTFGWNAIRSSFAVGDVVRTSDTIATITLSAASTYAILATETITVTVPASAIVYGSAIASPPTFDISPSFVESGTWVSPAIDLSPITDLSYCAIGWSTTLPAGTSVVMEYSLDGGGSYSSATNGSCPLTLRSNPSNEGITDLRIKATLTRTLATTTPQVDALGLIFGDIAGQTVRYQLVDTPALTIADRTGNGYAGTMSFPTQPSGVDTTVGSMTAIRAATSAQIALGVPQMTSPVTGTAVSDNLFNLDETGWATLPGYDIVNSMSTAGDGLPIQFVWYIFLGFLIIMGGFFALNLTQSLFAAAVTMGIGIGAALAIGGGLMPGWVIFVFIPIAVGLIFLRPRLAI